MFYKSAVIGALAVLVAAGCAEESTTSISTPLADAVSAPAPAGVTTLDIGGEQFSLWPYTGTDLAGTPSDPINLIFSGRAGPRALRAALFALDGSRQAFGMPNAFPFNCTWSDAYGDVQTAYAAPNGWSASVIQLQCGSYAPLRFHLRLFPSGDYTMADAHFEVLIPGTADHQVLSWKVAKQLVIVDFLRSGLLGAQPFSIPGLHPVQFRGIPAPIYNGLPAELKQLAGGPASTTTDVPIQSDGAVTILTLARAATIVPDTRNETLTLQYNQIIPRPFCSTGPTDFVLVQGPVKLDRIVTQSAEGNLIAHMTAEGALTVTPVNPVTGERGETATATIADSHELLFGSRQLSAISQVSRKEKRGNGEGTSLQTRLQVGPVDKYSRTERCN